MMTFITPPVERPNSAEKFPRTTCELADGLLADNVGNVCPLTAALAAKEWLIEISAIDVDVAIDAARS